MKRIGLTSALVSLLLTLFMPLTALAAEYERGDLNRDGYVDVGDVTTIISMALGTATANPDVADLNGDGLIDVSDVTALIKRVLVGYWSDEQHEYVNLGLPSGTLWATCNVGANAPEKYGDYFAWGETIPKNNYGWSTYKWCKGTSTTMTKYCTQSNYGYNGFTDGKTELGPEDDAAYVNWGSSWRMPTKAQQDELRGNCTWTWTTRNGVNGQLVTGPNGNTIFLPAAGYRCDEVLCDVGSWGNYWSRTLYTNDCGNAYYLYFDSDLVYRYGDSRYYGSVVRAVRIN